MVKLDVPLYRQKWKSPDCGPIAIRMLLTYYNINKSLAEIKKGMNANNRNTSDLQRGCYLLEQGFNVEVVGIQQKLFTKKDEKLSQKEILSYLRNIYDKTSDMEKRRFLEWFIQFMEMGGKFIMRIPSVKDIKDEIKLKRPVLASATTNYLTGEHPGRNKHATIIIGIDKKYIYVNDPNPKYGGSQKHLIEDYIYAIHSRPGFLTKVKPKKK